MLTGERQQMILRNLSLRNTVTVGDLAREARVSGETIRTDLIYLEGKGKLRRIRGGAQRMEEARKGLPLPEREALNREEKALIAKRACGLIRPRDTIFLDASSTVLTMTEYFPDQEVTVLTNANHVVVALGNRQGIDLICTGGDYEERSRSYTGILAENAVQRYYLQWMFIGVDAIDSVRGASEVNPGQARLKERIIPVAEKVCVLADYSKLERKSSFFFATPRQISCLITDSKADPAVLDKFRSQGIEIIVCG